MFEIQVADADITGGSIPVSWCLDIETIDQLASKGAMDPQVVIIISPEDDYSKSKETRVVAPLRDLMAYVPFKVAGKLKIDAFIDFRANCQDEYLPKTSRGEYLADLLTTDGKEWGYIFPYKNIEGDDPTRSPTIVSPTVLVGVPEQAFAKKPSQWQQNWVNHYFANKPEDQCEFRRRRLFAFTVQPVLIAFWTLVKAAALVLALSIGSVKVKLKPLFSPLSPVEDGTVGLFGRSIFIKHLPEDDNPNSPNTFIGWVSYLVRSFYLLPFMPAVVIAGVWLYCLDHKNKVILLLLFGLIALAIVGIVLIAVSKQAWTKFWRGESDVSWYTDREEIDLLTCDLNKKPLTFKSLPKNKQTLRLRFYTLKAQICRPFSA